MDSAAARELQVQQQELQRVLVERQRLETQLQESRIVKDEFDKLKDDAKVFKMIGPVLVPQEKAEADANVSRRLEFVGEQIKQTEEKLKMLQESLVKKQAEFRSQMAAAGPQTPAQAAAAAPSS